MRKIGPREPYHAEPSLTSEILPALRELLSRYPDLAYSTPEELQLRLHNYLSWRPEVCEIEVAMEALRVEGQVLA